MTINTEIDWSKAIADADEATDPRIRRVIYGDFRLTKSLHAFFLAKDSMTLTVEPVVGCRHIYLTYSGHHPTYPQQTRSENREFDRYFLVTPDAVLYPAHTRGPKRLIGIGQRHDEPAETQTIKSRRLLDDALAARNGSAKGSNELFHRFQQVERPSKDEWRLIALATLGTELGYGWLGDNAHKLY